MCFPGRSLSVILRWYQYSSSFWAALMAREAATLIDRVRKEMRFSVMCNGAEGRSGPVFRSSRPRPSQMNGVQFCSPPRSTLAPPKDKSNPNQWLRVQSGAGEGTRTPDPRLTRSPLYQLSYTGQPQGSDRSPAARAQAPARPRPPILPTFGFAKISSGGPGVENPRSAARHRRHGAR